MLAIIGGSGVYQAGELTSSEELTVDTPYGAPSDAIVRGVPRGGSVPLLFLSRHGRGHRVPPTAVNYRANICALKKLGATHLLSVTAVGSMREEIAPGHLVVVDQFIDLTKRRVGTFFDKIAAHVSFSDPVCPVLSDRLFSLTQSLGFTAHRGGSYVCIEGPQFSTRAESLVYRSWGVSVIGMTAMPEAKLAREAELSYSCLALATDYDCWHVSEEAVTVEAVVAAMKRNSHAATQVFLKLSQEVAALPPSPSSTALRGSIMTAHASASPEGLAELSWLLGEGPAARRFFG